jgi:hypothetical protein
MPGVFSCSFFFDFSVFSSKLFSRGGVRMIAFFRRMLVKGRSLFLGGFLLGGILSGAWAQEPILDLRRSPEGDYCYVVTSEPGGLYGLSFSDFENLGGALSEDALYSLSLSPEGDLLLATFQEVLFSRNRGKTWSSLRGGGDLKNFYITPQGTFVGVSWRKGFLWASLPAIWGIS